MRESTENGNEEMKKFLSLIDDPKIDGEKKIEELMVRIDGPAMKSRLPDMRKTLPDMNERLSQGKKHRIPIGVSPSGVEIHAARLWRASSPE